VGERPRLVVATRSPHKLAELRDLLDVPNAELLTLDDLGVDGDVDETGSTFEENAILKARAALAATGLPALADDSGLEVDALDGGPGVRTRRFAGERATDPDNNAKLLDVLDGLPAARRGAQYVCVLALALPDRDLQIVRGTCRGRIATTPRGTGGFGYDPIFEPASEPPGGRTLGEWTQEAKNAISHRGAAARRMAPILRDLGF
jgi:XTP/dITP diphosphohydrolase